MSRWWRSGAAELAAARQEAADARLAATVADQQRRHAIDLVASMRDQLAARDREATAQRAHLTALAQVLRDTRADLVEAAGRERELLAALNNRDAGQHRQPAAPAASPRIVRHFPQRPAAVDQTAVLRPVPPDGRHA